jgi:hypothetical protein
VGGEEGVGGLGEVVREVGLGGQLSFGDEGGDVVPEGEGGGEFAEPPGGEAEGGGRDGGAGFGVGMVVLSRVSVSPAASV